MNHRRLCLISLVGVLAVSGGPLFAIPSGERVQKNAEEVFSRPEFSRLQRLRRSDLVREDLSRRSPDGNGEGHGQQNGRGDGGERQGNDARDGRGGDREDPGDRDNDFNRNRNPGNDNNSPPQREDSYFGPSASFGAFGAGMAGLFTALGVLAIVVMLVVIVVMAVKSILERESRLDEELTGTFADVVGELEANHPPSEYSSEEYLRRAGQFAQQGEFRQAVACVLLGAMSEVESRGFIRYRKGLTQRDYYRTVRRHETIGPAYRNILKIYEPLGFGRRTAELKHYQSAVKSFRGGFGDRIAISEV